MCNFNKQNDETKAFIHLFMQKAADSIGGTNFLLALIEAMRLDKPNPLINKACKIESQKASIKWNKIVFKDKFDVLENIILTHKSSENPDFNILNIENQKQKKKILNMVKTLAPIEFVVKTKELSDGDGFNFKIFEKTEDNDVRINPIFIAMFFCSTEFTKKSLRYTI